MSLDTAACNPCKCCEGKGWYCSIGAGLSVKYEKSMETN